MGEGENAESKPGEERRALYRVQLHRGFTFADAARLASYLDALGISHVYCSPCLQAVPGSPHGYDVVDHGRLNEELGGRAGYERMVAELHQAGLGSPVLDIVPNHMAVDGRANQWWWDVLENGPESRYAHAFDIDWHGPDERASSTVLVPILADHYGRVLEAAEIFVVFDGETFVVRYSDHELPLSPRTIPRIIGAAAAHVGNEELAALASSFARLGKRAGDCPATASHDEKLILFRRLRALHRTRPEVAAAIAATIATLNADPDLLDALLRRQHYRLAHWKTASEELDFRRFFNIETLVGLRVEDDRVFDQTHRLILDLVGEGSVGGLRIDHVDGLRDPGAYLERLQSASAGTFTVVEKILGLDERLPSWPIAGTTGYEFLNRVNGLFVATANEQAFTDAYAAFTDVKEPYEQVVRETKEEVLRHDLAAELERLVNILTRVCAGHRRHRDHTRRDLRAVVRAFLVELPVYRTYFTLGGSARPVDRALVATTAEYVTRDHPQLDAELVQFVAELLVLEHQGANESEFALRFQQTSPAVMAKGVEDTAFYRFNRLTSLNEVGGEPGVFGASVESFHRATARTAVDWPRTVLTLSTHDTKRSSDVRARINVLSELPEAWERAMERWAARNERHWGTGGRDPNMEWLFYQTVVGAWPITTERLVAFITKAAREAKVHTSWADPQPSYEDALTGFVRGAMHDPGFAADLVEFMQSTRIVDWGRTNSLAQTALLLTCPGVPDIYQGSELWDLSLVDPDNRQPVDYHLRRHILDELVASDGRSIGRHPEAGGVKLWLLRTLLQHRRAKAALYRTTSYEPMPVEGARSDHLVAFSRGALAVVVPRLVASCADRWETTAVGLPHGTWTNLLGPGASLQGTVPVDELFATVPVAILERTRG